ncbi:ATP-binding cassette domain-containing protein [Demequina sp.]|uniref:ATP-binding cassette domain-containing protein n=1 Tax=Demequina sp. TaxID=2050685 RepID=UPI0025BC334A|nr:ATP-binding cassette domain-containing protein [Demequina sp.]
MPSTLSFTHLSFAWPDGRTVFRDLTFALPSGLSGMVGRNGIGKTTLARLAVADLAPTAGSVARPDRFAYVPQHVALAVDDAVADVLGIGATVRALRAIEGGSTDPADYDAVADDWLVEERAHATLDALGLGNIGLDRRIGQVSGGEATLLAVGASLLAASDVLLLDEPTNNLDADARERLVEALVQRQGTTAVITHDRALLSRVERIGELREKADGSTELRWFGGAIAAFEEAVAAEQDGARQVVAGAVAHAARERRDLVARVESAGKRRRQAASARANAKVTRAGVKVKTDQAARTEARVRHVHEDRLDAATARLADARAAIERDRSIRIDLPLTAVPHRRVILRAAGLVTRTGECGDVSIVGPERIVIAGANGSGKTTLIETLLGTREPVVGTVAVRVPTGYLPQRLDLLDDALSVVDNVRRRAPEVAPQEVRDQLGKFQFRGAAADALAATLSGGERFRAALACVLLARPAPQLLVLDEPTNNLDFASQEHLAQALEGYGGALVVVSHDPAFVESIAPTRRWTLGEGLEDVPLQ